MNIKLRLLSNWLPKFILIKELQKTSDITNDYLDKLLKKYYITPPVMENHGKVNLEKLRTLMATVHNQKVKALVELLGREKAVEVGRAQMFKAGYKMGCEARESLGVGENIEDAIAAAHLLYKVLGIKFHVENSGKDIILRVNSCALAVQYTPETCEVMSAADKGVLKGLNSNMDLEFIERITEGAEECKACINIKK
jgi:predicted ArsR family transcriptional regulator